MRGPRYRPGRNSSFKPDPPTQRPELPRSLLEPTLLDLSLLCSLLLRVKKHLIIPEDNVDEPNIDRAPRQLRDHTSRVEIGGQVESSGQGTTMASVGLNDESGTLRLTAIVPARNAAATLGRCLDALLAQVSADDEVIVVDDYSTDETSEIASRYDVNVIRLSSHQGVSAARNRGAQLARAPVLFFVDADVVVAPGTVTRAHTMMSKPDVGAVIGSYDDDPGASSTISRFKNLAHHYFHQHSSAEAITFWGACGLVRRESFFALGGFNEYRRLSIEDVELGYALAAQGFQIILDRDLQVKHLKKWTLWSMIVTDVVRRAIPWTLLCLEHQQLPNKLNLSTEQRVAAIVTLAITLVSTIAIVQYRLWLVVAALVSIALWLNIDLYRLFLRKGGLRLAVSGFFLQQLYYLYAMFGLVAGLTVYFTKGFMQRRQATLNEIEHD